MPNQYSITLSDVSAHYLQKLNDDYGWKTSHIIDVALQLCMFDNLAMFAQYSQKQGAYSRLDKLLKTKKIKKVYVNPNSKVKK